MTSVTPSVQSPSKLPISSNISDTSTVTQINKTRQCFSHLVNHKKNFWSKKMFWSRKKFSSEKSLGLKKILGPKKIL